MNTKMKFLLAFVFGLLFGSWLVCFGGQELATQKVIKTAVPNYLEALKCDRCWGGK